MRKIYIWKWLSTKSEYAYLFYLRFVFLLELFFLRAADAFPFTPTSASWGNPHADWASGYYLSFPSEFGRALVTLYLTAAFVITVHFQHTTTDIQ